MKEVMRVPTNTESVSILESANVRRLLPDEMVFSKFSFDLENAITFRIHPMFDVSEVLGVPVSAGDRVSAAAHYDMLRRSALRTLEVTIHPSTGREYAYRYMLTDRERQTLTEKMETYYFKSTGVTLEQVCREHQAGTVPPPRPRDKKGE